MKQNLLGENIRKLRIQQNMTQNDLANIVGYSKKTISKWELGDCYPNIDTLMMLADIFGKDINTLVGYKGEISYYLGIDGGATKTDFVLCDENGTIRHKCRLSSCNPVDVGISQTKQILNEGILEITKLGIAPGKISVFAGISGGITGNNKEIIGNHLATFGFAKYENGSDIDNAVSVALGEKNGVVSIMGTGNVTFAVNNEKRVRIGGYGYYFDDGGSGFDIGQACIRAALKAHDGSGMPTKLLDMCEEYLNMSVVSAIGMIYQKGKSYVASFAPLVFEAYKSGDEVSALILNSSLKSLSDNLNASVRYFSDDRIYACLVGGLCENSDILLPILKPYLNERIEIDVCHMKQYVGALKNAGLVSDVIDE